MTALLTLYALAGLIVAIELYRAPTDPNDP